MAPVEIGSPEWLHNRDVLMAEQAAEIAKMGWAAVGVFPAEGSEDNYHFCYTIGRALSGKAELIVTGLSQNAAPALEWLIDEWGHLDVQEPGVPFSVNPEAQDGERFVLAPVPDDERLKHMTMTHAQVGPDFVALQVLWTDDEGRWPWDEGHARQVRMVKEGDTLPILAGNDWRPAVSA